MTNSNATELLKRQRELVRAGRINEASELLAANAGLVDSDADLLVGKSVVIRLSDNERLGRLEDAELALRRALVLRPQHFAARVELGWYLLNVADDAKAALEFFSSALPDAAEMSTEREEVVEGIVSCLREVTSEREAMEFAKDANGISASKRAQLLGTFQ